MNLEEILNWVDKTGMIGNLKTGGYLFNIGYDREDHFYWLSKSAIDNKGYIKNDRLLDIRNPDRNEFIREVCEKLPISGNDEKWNNWKKSKRSGHGGKREGSGRKSEYNNLKTKLIRGKIDVSIIIEKPKLPTTLFIAFKDCNIGFVKK